MKLPINEWSVSERSGSFLKHAAWTDFISSVNKLAKEYDFQKVLFVKSDFSLLKSEIYALSSNSQRLHNLSFLSKHIESYDLDCSHSKYICLPHAEGDACLLLSLAYHHSQPVISINYKSTYCCDTFQGTLYHVENKRTSTVTIRNIYPGNVDKYGEYFLTGIPDDDIDPIKKPIWNMERTLKYISQLPNTSSMDKGELKSHLYKIGTYIARLNGWKEDKNLSRINSQVTGNMRHVFYPEKFRHSEKAFLSIDFEKQAFELHDHKGRHVCEILYDGKVNAECKFKHDIKLKR